MDPFEKAKSEIGKSIKTALAKLKFKAELAGTFEIPPNAELGDLACNVAFELGKKSNKNPKEIAEKIVKEIKKPALVSEIKTVGPYINFYFNKEKIAELVLKQALDKDFGVGKKLKQVAIVEFPGPNTNKPLHLGHLRNLSLGESISRLLENQGYKVGRVNLNNDRGVHICKSMLAYKKWGKGKKPDKKSDHFVGDFYVIYNQKVKEHPELEEEVREMLRKWEAGDKETIALWKKMTEWAVKGFDATYEKFGNIKFDKTYNESDMYKKGKEVVNEGLKKKIFYRDESGAVLVDLTKYGLDKKILLRADGTAVYMTQDLQLTKERYKDFKMDRAIWVVGSEQIYHFNVLFRIFELMKFPFTKGCYHLAYGMVHLPEGRMKSREGRIVDADDIRDEMENLAKTEVKKRNKELSGKEVEKIAEQIGLGAIKFFLLKHNARKDFMFDPDKSISFEGETGPYVQYAAVRAKRILEKAGKFDLKNLKFELLKLPEELELIKELGKFPGIVQESILNYEPNILAKYVYNLAEKFNSFYTVAPVIKAENNELKKARLAIVKAAENVLIKGLYLLGIEAPERM